MTMVKQKQDDTGGPETPIFTRTCDFLTWLLPATNNFPRAHRHTFTRRLLDAAFDPRERLKKRGERVSALTSAWN
jgi:hypothetical protein